MATEPALKRTIAFFDGQNLCRCAKTAFGHHYPNYQPLQLAQAVCGIKTYSRPLRYRNQTVLLPDGAEHTFLVGQEKGIDIRIALDVVRMARSRDYDVALIFSQDQDLSEVADEVRQISIEQDRWIKVASAFPFSPTTTNRRGVNETDWVRIDRHLYDACLDANDYRMRADSP